MNAALAVAHAEIGSRYRQTIRMAGAMILLLIAVGVVDDPSRVEFALYAAVLAFVSTLLPLSRFFEARYDGSLEFLATLPVEPSEVARGLLLAGWVQALLPAALWGFAGWAAAPELELAAAATGLAAAVFGWGMAAWVCSLWSAAALRFTSEGAMGVGLWIGVGGPVLLGIVDRWIPLGPVVRSLIPADPPGPAGWVAFGAAALLLWAGGMALAVALATEGTRRFRPPATGPAAGAPAWIRARIRKGGPAGG